MKKSINIILLLAIPSILENLFQVLIGFTDTYFIGKLGTDGIVGVSGSNLMMNIYISFYLAIGVGTTALISRRFGANDLKNVRKTLAQSLLLATILSITLSLTSIVLSRNLLNLLGLSDLVITKTLSYFNAITLSTIPLAITTVLSSGLRSTGDTKTPMKVGLTVNIINIILNYVLIFGIFNIRGLGLFGAGLASLIARCIGSFLLLIRVRNNEILYNSKEGIKILTKLDPELLTNICKISLPAAIEKLIMRSGQVLYGTMIIGLGRDIYAAHNIAGTIESFSYLPAMGFGVASATLIGQNLGKNDISSAKKYGWLSYSLSSIFMIIIATIFAIFAPSFSSLFTKDITIINHSTKALRIIFFVQPFLASTMVLTSSLQGAGDTKFPMFTTLIGIWSFRVLGIYLLGVKLNLGISGVWLAIAFDIIIRGSILILRFKRGKWTKIVLTK